MNSAPAGLVAASQAICQPLLETAQPVPADTLFRDDIFKTTCQRIDGKNKARDIQDITPLIVPSAKTFYTYGADHLKHLIKSINER